MQVNISSMEGERDFYFSKLRDIELLCQSNEDNPIVGSILDIMYATQVSGREGIPRRSRFLLERCPTPLKSLYIPPSEMRDLMMCPY